MHRRSRDLFVVAAGLALALGLLVAPASAEARGTWFLLEANGSLAESTFEGGESGFGYGLAAGATWKLRRFPLRFHLLAAFTERSAHSRATTEGIAAVSYRQDYDLYLAHRVALPLFGPYRIYAELGAGQRWLTERVERGGSLGGVSASSTRPVVVFAGGVTARFSKRLSLGLRGELTQAGRGADLIESVTGVRAEESRAALVAQLGVHF